jgi:hypothetical protein
VTETRNQRKKSRDAVMRTGSNVEISTEATTLMAKRESVVQRLALALHARETFKERNSLVGYR